MGVHACMHVTPQYPLPPTEKVYDLYALLCGWNGIQVWLTNYKTIWPGSMVRYVRTRFPGKHRFAPVRTHTHTATRVDFKSLSLMFLN